jgi:hypothetical protein
LLSYWKQYLAILPFLMISLEWQCYGNVAVVDLQTDGSIAAGMQVVLWIDVVHITYRRHVRPILVSKVLACTVLFWRRIRSLS